MEEQLWITNILAGDTQSFSCLVAKYQQMAFTIAFRILQNQEEAEEVVQDAFVKMYNALPTFEFKSKFSTWFYKIVYNTSLTAQRKQNMYVRYEDSGPEEVTNEEYESGITILEREDRKEVISHVMKLLPTEEALILSLFYLEENAIEDIHEITGLTVSNIKVKLFRGRKHFYEKLQQYMKTEIVNVI